MKFLVVVTPPSIYLMTSPKNLVQYQEIDLHIILDIKLGENFRSKSRLVTG